MHTVRSQAVLVLVLSLLPLVAVAQTPDQIDVRIDPSTSSSLLVEILQVEPRMGKDLEIFLRIENLSNARLDRAEITIEQRAESGRTRAFHGMVHDLSLEPGEEIYVSRLSGVLRPHRGDVFVLGILPYVDPDLGPPEAGLFAKNGISERFAISTCTTFCDRCSNRALALCGEGGVAEYDCSCSDANANCSIKCAQ